MRYVLRVTGVILMVLGALPFFHISADDVKSFFTQTPPASGQKNAVVSLSAEIYILCQTESTKDPHISKDFNSVEKVPGYIVNENISVDTGLGSSLPLKGGFIERSRGKAIALEGHYPEVLRPIVEYNTKIQETLVRAKDLGESLKNNQ